MLRSSLAILLFSATTSAFFFGGGGGGCGCQPQPACAPPPPPSPCGGGSVVSGYVGNPQPAFGGSYAAPQGFPSPQGYQALPPPPPPPTYQQAPLQPPQQVVPQQVPLTDSYNANEQQVAVADIASEASNYQNTGTNVVEAAQAAAELISQQGIPASAAASKVAEVVELDDEPVNKKKDEGKTSFKKITKSTDKPTTPATTTESTAGEELVPENNQKEIDIAELQLIDDPLCNSDDLRKVVVENIDSELNSSKRMIQLAAEAQFGGRFDVICANGDFSYVTNTELYCQETKGDISCYTYRQL